MKRVLTPILLVALILLGVPGETRADGISFGVGAGVITSDDFDASKLWLTGNLRFNLSDNLVLEPEAGWYGETHVNVFNFGGSALILIPTERVELFAGGGVGAHMYQWSGEALDESEAYLGLHVLGGLDLAVSDTWKLFGATRYEIIQADGGNAKQWKFYGGLRLGGN